MRSPFKAIDTGTVSQRGTAVSGVPVATSPGDGYPEAPGPLLLGGNLVLQILSKPSTHLVGIVVAVGGYRMLRCSNQHFVFLT